MEGLTEALFTTRMSNLFFIATSLYFGRVALVLFHILLDWYFANAVITAYLNNAGRCP